MLKTLSKVISSSISMAFLVVLGWSVAYAYGWGQSYFYGFPWWYVDVGSGNVARSLGYVIWATIILLLTYLIGLFGLKKVKPYMSERCVNLLRTYILCTIFFIPIPVACILLVGKLNSIFAIVYIITTFIFTLLFKNYFRNHISTISIHVVIRFFHRNKSYVMLFMYCYFVIFGFIMGYVRPNFKIIFDSMEVEKQSYYVLAKYSDTFILSRSIRATNGDFYIYKMNPNSICHIKVVDIRKLGIDKMAPKEIELKEVKAEEANTEL
ncbi:hypothetical protein NJ8700_02930 [Aggregatibacter aphrophilus NJ8700]|jgi:hypothetical protein|uniref:hypothetical protein n=1 Tax=Aggregatibacter aphrophilus TaxID=732 RepID=UPI0001AAE325|nr:hypothetical protein [Aggregatibacter aphrophilus]ACS97026.1 conserved hypothetical protein [Aggregatibacter aphrophilus NJ8700]AKS64391.1 hypothetical protein NJ8700_02930 [Aggregatibacter aphrophilus NJ8700]EHB90416.1 hypothetical protein HMPREF9335_00106 [Aggregatibacter aphrophilus F0387]PNL93674.1 hypothetical protein A6J76_006795 [Aggregatibacter aphrophilus]RDE84409.1 hypothetical protein DPW00_09985 [Aggregatibacter aphrophilus]